MIERRILSREEIPAEFFEISNVWNRYAECRFHHSLSTSGIEVERKRGESFEDMGWIKSQLGGHNWDLVNMHLSQDHKIAWCAYMFSQVLVIVAKPDRLHEGPRPEVKSIFHPDNKEELRKQIKASMEKERQEEESRQEKIKSGEITLPDKTRPYEVWFTEDGKERRLKTARSREALAKSIEFAGLHPGSYREAFCSSEHEDSRTFFN